MIKLGDIVTPEDGYWGHGYFLFRVSSLVRTMGCENKYKLQRIEQELDFRKGPLSEQLAIIERVEDSLWGENELQVLEPTPDYPQEIRDVKYYKNELSKFLNKKEEKEMDILDLYKERKNQLLMDEFYKSKKEIIKEDEIQKIKEEMINQINTILDNEGRSEKFEVLAPEFCKNIVTKQTQEKINNLEINLDSEKDKLYNTIQEVKALFELTDDYEERIKILKNYNILDKNGKLSV